MESGQQYDVVIIGGGIAGLAAAWELRDRNIMVLEADTLVGGRMRSEERGEYWLNVGGHLIEGPGSVMHDLCDELGLEVRVAPGDPTAVALKGKVVAGGRPETYPFRLPLSLGGRLSFIRAGLKMRQAARKYMQVVKKRPGETPAEFRLRHLAFMGDQSFADFLGKVDPDVWSIFDAVIERMTCNNEQCSAGCGVSIFGHVWSKDSLLVRNIVGGSGKVPQAISRQLGERVVTGAAAASVKDTGNGFEVGFTVAGTAQNATAKHVIVATPAYVAKEIVVDLPADTRAALEEIHYGPYLVAGILTGETKPMPWDKYYAVATPGKIFNFIFNHANVVHGYAKERKPGGSLMVYGAGDYAKRHWDLSDDEIKRRMEADLYSVFPEATGVVKEIWLRRIEHGYPYVRPGRHQIQPALEKDLGNLYLAGDYMDWASMEPAAISGIDAARKAKAKLDAAGKGEQ